jgi:hypothetical protein
MGIDMKKKLSTKINDKFDNFAIKSTKGMKMGLHHMNEKLHCNDQPSKLNSNKFLVVISIIS